MTAFIGLGNVGSHFAGTKHNFGFWVIDELAQRWVLSFRPGKGDYVFAENEGVLVAKATSGMNRSGVPVREICDRWGLEFEDMYVVVDDVDLPLGAIRIRPGGGHGTHRGLESVISILGTTEFPRIRMGIGTDEPMRPAERYVLRPFRKEDESLAREMIIRGADAIESILSVGLEKTMSQYNRAEVEKSL